MIGVALEAARQAHIDQLGPSLRREDDIGRLDITVHDRAAGRVHQGLCDLKCDVDRFAHRKRSILVDPPANCDARAPEGERPPYVVWAHGGPASHADRTLDLQKAYFTSRGIGIIDVNYGGSTGYGRSYRERLRRQWGVVDVEDVIAAARALVQSGEADTDRLAIRGFSAGGWTALAAVTTHARDGHLFKAAVSYSGIADLRGFAAKTHDFESRYLDGLIGPLPGFQALYAERSPLGHVTDDTVPVLLLQGEDDRIVLPAQARGIARELKAHGVRYALLEFEGESHGFRRAETIISSKQAELFFYGRIFGVEPADELPETPIENLA